MIGREDHATKWPCTHFILSITVIIMVITTTLLPFKTPAESANLAYYVQVLDLIEG